jgi:RNA polymerase sigma factor (TIGR02999 family)
LTWLTDRRHEPKSGVDAHWPARALIGDPAARVLRERGYADDVNCGKMQDMSETTRLLEMIEQGDPSAANQLLPLVYDELRRLAVGRLAREKPGQTLQATALVHEAYLRLVGDQKFAGRGHFFAAAAEAMRRILIERARHKLAARHGGGLVRVELRDLDLATECPPDELLLLDDALTKLAIEDPSAALLVKLRYYSGLEVEEAAEIAGVSRATAFRHWAFARAWLLNEMANSTLHNEVPQKKS